MAIRIGKILIKTRLLLLTFGLGLIHGIASLFGIVQGFEYFIWIAIAVICVFWISGPSNKWIFWSGLFSGLAVAIGTGLAQGLFLDTYLQNNPEYAQRLDDQTNYRLFTLLFMFVFGTIYGIIIGAISIALHQFRKNTRHVS